MGAIRSHMIALVHAITTQPVAMTPHQVISVIATPIGPNPVHPWSNIGKPLETIVGEYFWKRQKHPSQTRQRVREGRTNSANLVITLTSSIDLRCRAFQSHQSNSASPQLNKIEAIHL
jgi:hypothetical protein